MIFRMICFWLITMSFFLLAQEGTLDTSFGNNGIVIKNIASMDDYLRDIAIQTDGKIVVAGSNYNGADYFMILMRYNVDGSLDSSFGLGGIVTASVNGQSTNISALVIQTDGKIVVAGSVSNGVDYDVLIMRYQTDGTLDNSFGNNGMVITTVGSFTDSGRDLVIQQDGKIILVGQTRDSNNINDVLVMRYNIDGSLDNTFGNNGIIVTAVSSQADVGQAIDLQDDGKIVIAGRTKDINNIVYILLLRYNIDGSLDNSFDSDGIVIASVSGIIDRAWDLTIQSDGKIIVAGDTKVTNNDFLLMRYNTDGTLDTSFDGDGIVITALTPNYDSYAAITIQSNGKLVACGSSDWVNNTTPALFTLARYNTDGSLDTSFGINGIVTTDVGTSDDVANCLCIQSDGQIVAAGSTRNTESDCLIIRYNGTAVTVIELVYFKAKHESKTTENVLEWKTATEKNNAGFHLWRSEKVDGKYEKITESIILAKGNATTGAKYSHRDFKINSDKTYFYKLEDIDENAKSTMHGPVKVVGTK